MGAANKKFVDEAQSVMASEIAFLEFGSAKESSLQRKDRGREILIICLLSFLYCTQTYIHTNLPVKKETDSISNSIQTEKLKFHISVDTNLDN